ncbi:uncharacterized protein V2V93DRAFT_391964 [Kockiozyma suomiensis]|uniref:uncharacterized protein n=1 Tax=Kockiozyma suomiensis TaxID=1337062 RepID=UPI0033442F6D
MATTADSWLRDIGLIYRRTISQRRSMSASADSAPFIRQLQNLSHVPMIYEDVELLDYALEILPLQDLYAEAEDLYEKDKSWSTQDYLIRALLKWFRNSFFVWVNALKCTRCSSESNVVGSTQPTPDELRDGAHRVEIHECKSCQHRMRFPRYDHPRKLLTFRKGRCGEWANCFGLLCRALGSRTRWIWNAEDHVWTEVYSDAQKRWIHADVCETAWDQPRLYEEGWGKKMSYVIAFSAEGAKDVTKRYVRVPEKAIHRTKISETELGVALRNITTSRRASLSPQERASLESEDKDEIKEFVTYIYGMSVATSSEENRPRETGAGEWTRVRGEDGAH